MYDVKEVVPKLSLKHESGEFIHSKLKYAAGGGDVFNDAGCENDIKEFIVFATIFCIFLIASLI